MTKVFVKNLALSLLIVPFLALGACDVLGIGGVTGEYELTTVNGESVPYSTEFGTIESGKLVLESDNSYTAEITFSFGEETETSTDNGTFEVDGETITFTDSENETFTGTVDGNTITVDDDGQTMVFEK